MPILYGTAFKNKGVQPLLDAVIDYLPCPVDIPPVDGRRPQEASRSSAAADDNEPFAALAFKIMSDPHVGQLTYFRVYSGKLDQGDAGAQRDRQEERLGRILQMHANHREDIEGVFAGDIVAAVGLKNTKTGDTLCDPRQPIILEKMVFPEPVIRVAIEPKTKVDQDKMAKALGALSDEDPTFHVRTDEETGQTIMGGMGELHLEVLVDRMLREFKVDANIGKPQVAYRETITSRSRRSRPTSARPVVGPVRRRHHQRRADRPGRRLRVRRQDHAAAHPARVHPGGQRRHQRGDGRRCAGGLPVVNVRVTLIDGKYHDVDSSEMAFKIAGSIALKEAARKAKPCCSSRSWPSRSSPPTTSWASHRRPQLAPGQGRGHGAARQQRR